MSSIPHSHKKSFFRRRWVWVVGMLVVLVVAFGVASAQGVFTSGTADLDYLKDTVKVEKRTVSKTITTTGTVVPDYTESIVIPTGGTITELPYKVGDNVDKNETLVKTSTGVTVKAPFSGRVTALSGVVDGQISPAAPVMDFSYRSNHIEFFASESEVIDLEVGQKVSFTIPSYNSGKDTYDGEVMFVDLSKQVSGVTATGQAQESGYRVKVSMNNLPEQLSKVLGLTVDMTIKVASVDDATAISTSAVQYNDDNEPFVYLPPVIDDAFAAKARAAEDVETLLTKKEITIGQRGDTFVEVKEGLSVGDSVLLYVPTTKTGSFGF